MIADSTPAPLMIEYDVYLPARTNDGEMIDPAVIDGIKSELVKAFGGYTHFTNRSEGVWRIGGVTFRDEVTIVRVLDDGTAKFDMAAFQRSTEAALRQEQLLIVAREVRVVSSV